MSLLIELRKRIKAIEVTKKTTNAMRLIAMSAHTRLKETKEKLTLYQQGLVEIRQKLAAIPIHPTLAATHTPKRLIVVVGSQKGLCGNFNAAVAAYALSQERTRAEHGTLLVIGKQLGDIFKLSTHKITTLWPELGSAQIALHAHALAEIVLSKEYTEITLYSTRAQGFFVSRPKTTTINPSDYGITWPSPTSTPHVSTPLNASDQMPSASIRPDMDLLFEQSYTETWDTLGSMTLQATLELLLLDSLLAEQAARFISMDAATRNAEELMVDMKLNYNKLRQSAITRELTDLSGSFM